MTPLHEVEIDGKKGLAVYMTDDWQPTTKELATMVKIVFEDGSNIIGHLSPAKEKP